MSSWQDVNLLTVSTGLELLPEQTFKLKLLGANENKFNADAVDVKAQIVDGEFAGRRVYLKYPAPSERDWAGRVIKRLIEKLGIPLEESEAHTPVAYFNRVAANPDCPNFLAPMKHRAKQDGTTVSEPDIFKVEAADAA